MTAPLFLQPPTKDPGGMTGSLPIDTFRTGLPGKAGRAWAVCGFAHDPANSALLARRIPPLVGADARRTLVGSHERSS